MNDKNLVIVSGATTFRDFKGKVKWFVVKNEDNQKWEVPKTTVRRGESSARATLRMMGEQGGMSVKIIEESGRYNAVATLNGKTLPQKYIYYLVIQLSAGEVIGFRKSEWMEYPKALRNLASKREQTMLKQARKEYELWKKKKLQKKPRE